MFICGDMLLNKNVFNWNAGSGMGAAAVFERGDVVDDLCNARVVQSNSLLSKDAR